MISWNIQTFPVLGKLFYEAHPRLQSPEHELVHELLRGRIIALQVDSLLLTYTSIVLKCMYMDESA